jgi:hypothetical protein
MQQSLSSDNSTRKTVKTVMTLTKVNSTTIQVNRVEEKLKRNVPNLTLFIGV